MELVQFLISFFVSKNVSLITAFLCWSPENLVLLYRAAAEQGVRVHILTNFHRLPPLEAYDYHREGALLDVQCEGADLVLQKASANRAFVHRYTWALFDNCPFNVTSIESTLEDTLVLPDCDVTWVAKDALADVYRTKQGEPLVVGLGGLHTNSSLQDLQTYWARIPAPVTRRKNLGNITVSAVTTITRPQYFRSWADVTERNTDLFPKFTYPLLLLCAEDFNIRWNIRQVDVYGVSTNGSFDGLVGLLQRARAEVGITSAFMRADRWRVLHYCAETYSLVGSFIFRQPSKSAVSNVFLLPFSSGVWAALAGVFALAAGLLALLGKLLARYDPELRQLSIAESVTFALGTICLQGSALGPRAAAARVVMLSALVAAQFLGTAHSAKIVALLQAPSDALRTVADLARSDMAMAVQDTTYKKTYFAESTDPATQELYRRKLLPQGEAAYMFAEAGIAKMRGGQFAYQVEVNGAYDIISKTFTEPEKCGLQEIEAFKLPMVAVPLRRHCGYRDLLASRLRWQRECGLLGRWRRMWLAARPACAAGAAHVRVRLRDVLPAVRAAGAGAGLAALLLLLEIVVHEITLRYNRLKGQHNTAITYPDPDF